jgi:nicotinate phosphoribosyltransferase
MLDEAGFQDTKIVVSNDLDEHIITSLKLQDAAIDIWGIGTKLVTAYDQPALGGVYKLAAIKNSEGKWEYKMKLSEQAIKISNPGLLQVRRFYDENLCMADMIYDENNVPKGESVIVDPMDSTRQKNVGAEVKHKNLLESIFEKGVLRYKSPSIDQIKSHAKEELDSLHSSIKRFANPHEYPVGLEKNLHQLKTDLILKLRHKQKV